jgi:hypothetical protein
VKRNRVGVLLEWLWNCAESCTVCMDVLTIRGPGARISGSEVVLSVLASEIADADSANSYQERDAEGFEMSAHQRAGKHGSSRCGFSALACWRHEMLRSESFFLVGAKGQKKEKRRTNSKLTRGLVQLLVTKTHPLSLIPRAFLQYPTTSRSILHLAQVDAIPPDIFPWRISRVAKGMGKQTPEAFASRGRVCR